MKRFGLITPASGCHDSSAVWPQAPSGRGGRSTGKAANSSLWRENKKNALQMEVCLGRQCLKRGVV